MDTTLKSLKARRAAMLEYKAHIEKQIAAARMALVQEGPEKLGAVMELVGQTDELQTAVDKLQTLIDAEQRALDIARNAKH
jgi:hypothetical protein